jgi:hypothetical protein
VLVRVATTLLPGYATSSTAFLARQAGYYLWWSRPSWRGCWWYLLPQPLGGALREELARSGTALAPMLNRRCKLRHPGGVYTAEGRKRKTIYGKTRQEVAAKLSKALADREGGLIFDAGIVTVGDTWISGCRTR